MRTAAELGSLARSCGQERESTCRHPGPRIAGVDGDEVGDNADAYPNDPTKSVEADEGEGGGDSEPASDESDDSSGFNIMILIPLTVLVLLAAIAIPMFLRYTKESKTAEPDLNLKTLASEPIYPVPQHSYTDEDMGRSVSPPIREVMFEPNDDDCDGLENPKIRAKQLALNRLKERMISAGKPVETTNRHDDENGSIYIIKEKNGVKFAVELAADGALYTVPPNGDRPATDPDITERVPITGPLHTFDQCAKYGVPPSYCKEAIEDLIRNQLGKIPMALRSDSPKESREKEVLGKVDYITDEYVNRDEDP